MKVANVVRIIMGFVLLGGAATNAYLALTQPEVYATFADLALIPLYRDLWQGLVMPHIRLWLVLVVLMEFTLGILILSKGVWVKVGMVAAILFFLFLVPFWWGGGALVNLVFILVLLWLLRYDYEASLFDIIRGRSNAV